VGEGGSSGGKIEVKWGNVAPGRVLTDEIVTAAGGVRFQTAAPAYHTVRALAMTGGSRPRLGLRKQNCSLTVDRTARNIFVVMRHEAIVAVRLLIPTAQLRRVRLVTVGGAAEMHRTLRISGRSAAHRRIFSVNTTCFSACACRLRVAKEFAAFEVSPAYTARLHVGCIDRLRPRDGIRLHCQGDAQSAAWAIVLLMDERTIQRSCISKP
jgi:hypothetical protein